MAFFKYTWDNTTRVLIPGQWKVDCKPNAIVEVDENHRDYNEKYYTYNNFILTKMEDKRQTKTKAPAKKTTKK